MTQMLDLRELALRIRLRAVRMVAPQGFGYLGQALSSAEQVAAVFGAARPGVDRIVCSPGHYIIGPFAAAAELGLATVSEYGQNGSVFEAIGTERSPVVDYLPADADGHFIKLPPSLAAAVAELTGKLEALRA